ncbi:hypothetical protein TVAG_005420 [Trichomonas vaginalis G3]|uniref:Uncharacterized protein n=1 Tax=Trichomonas vaginalis (strain ATCC PRA-98 / G3) TaxID=412133 RepID=A2ENS2_TRIV3|nr:hypothetical protein TVAGG3_0666690 [Trichomonas vaginalis G3]EAY05698.1 hypothetical protein TVAG_005420 [Trichomonas vaginalis G3]KAI5506878.1 hypothetical protein TVAGG3_0666690 [Trichomonas vaginalis G3]|eukprot:XP_001317921.1 hypothetical protein [Trichomonas vaginalis G3]
MSVRDRPAANRFLDMKEKEFKYRQHLNFVRTAKGGIDMTTPDVPPRLRLMKRNNAIYREKLIKNMTVHDRLIENARRPGTAGGLAVLDDIPLFPKRKTTTKLAALHDEEIYKVESAQGKRPNRVDTESETVMSPPSTSNRVSSSSSSSSSRSNKEQPENIRIETIEKNDGDKVCIITDKPDESQEMVVLPSEKHSEDDSSEEHNSQSSETKNEAPEQPKQQPQDKKEENNETEKPPAPENKVESNDEKETRQKTDSNSANFITGQTESMVTEKSSLHNIVQEKVENI